MPLFFCFWGKDFVKVCRIRINKRKLVVKFSWEVPFMNQEDTKATLKFVFEKSDNYIDTYATGVYGGLSVHGELNMYFVEDSIAFPESETIEITKDGNVEVIEQSYKQPAGTIRRIVKCKISINPNDIPSIVKWLNEKYEQYKSMKNVVSDK